MNEYLFNGILNGFTGRPWSGLRTLAVLPEADIDIQTSPVNTDADAILVPHNTARISVTISLAEVEIEVTNQVI